MSAVSAVLCLSTVGTPATVRCFGPCHVGYVVALVLPQLKKKVHWESPVVWRTVLAMRKRVCFLLVLCSSHMPVHDGISAADGTVPAAVDPKLH